MIRGDILPSNREGEIFIENDSVIKHRAAARQHLGKSLFHLDDTLVFLVERIAHSYFRRVSPIRRY